MGGVVDESVKLPTIGDDLESCTVELQAFPIPIEGQTSRLVIIDTPGFNDTYSSDVELLKHIGLWLTSS